MIRLIASLAALAVLGGCMDAPPMAGAPTEGEVFFVSAGGQERRIRMTPFGDGVNFNVYVQAPDRDSAITAYHAACWSSGTLDLAAWDTDMVPYDAATGEHSFVGDCPDKAA